MAQINVNNLTFAYEGSFDNVFENTSFSIDTNWRLGVNVNEKVYQSLAKKFTTPLTN